ncbi:MAG TPA: hypothetical protein VF624_08500 [Tepidisphaeraceae bacterium]
MQRRGQQIVFAAGPDTTINGEASATTDMSEGITGIAIACVAATTR